MYFSLITPEEGQEREAARQWAQGAYAEHQWLWQLFPAEAGTPRDFLFRRRDLEGLPRYYVVSKRCPSKSPGWQVWTSAYDPQLRVGDCLQFELRANPVVTRSSENKHTRHDVVMDAKKRLLAERKAAHWKDLQAGDKPSMHDLIHAECSAWLNTRAQRLGFAVDGERLLVEGYQHQTEKSGRLRFSTVDFTGRLTVTDPIAFSTTLCDGIGHAKAFGCGLLLVKPVG